MASQSAIAEGRSVVTADQINYEQKMFSHPSYKFEPQFPNTFGQTIALTTSQTPVTINVPPEVFNLAQSYLNYTVTLPGVGGEFTWYALNALQEISHIQFYSGNNQWIVDVDNLQNYLDIVLKKELPFDEWESNDDTIFTLTGIGVSNEPKNEQPALRNANMTTGNANGGQSHSSSLNYIEPAYFVTTAAADTQVQYNIQFPLRLIKNTAFSVDKNMYFGQQTYLKVYFGPLSKFCYQSTTGDWPSNGTKAAYAGVGPNISNLQLMLAVESNQELRATTINKVSTSGESYLIPYVQMFKNSNNGTSQNISIMLDQGNGRSLLKVYHAPYNNQEQLDTMYDHCNLPTNQVPGSATAQKVQQYYTQLNGKRVQDITIDCTFAGGFLDYMQHKRQLRGSIIRNLNIYQYNWFHCDDFSDFGPRYDQDNNGQLISGIPMSVAPLTWSFVGVTMAALNFQHYTYFVFIKKLTMAPGQVIVQ